MIPMLCFVAVLVIEYKGFRKRTKEYRELEHFAEFLSDLKNQFYLCKNVTESIFRAAERMPGSLRKRLEEICFLLEEDAPDAISFEERFPRHLKYVRLFWIQCRSAVQYGSGKNSAESVFIRNMTELRRDVQNECYQRAQAMYLFAGMGVVSAAPVVFLPFIEWFGSTMMEELQLFYAGRTAMAIVTIFGLLTAFCYILLCMVRKTDKRLYQRPDVIRRFFSISIFQRLAERYKGSRAEQIGAGCLAEIGLYENGMQYWIVCGCISGVTTLGGVWFSRGCVLTERLLFALGGMMVGLVIGVGFYKYIGYLRRIGMDGEVMMLQSMILLLLDVPNITMLSVLDVLGECSELFRKCFLQCADDYVSEDVKALESMFEKAENTAFRQLSGRLLASERVGLKEAFSESASDRHFFREQLKLDAEQERKKKAGNAQIITFLPMLFLLFAYLIFPFLAVSLKQMGDIFKEMEQIRYF